MATTAIFAEILIVGLEAAVWCSLLVLAIFGADWIDPSALSDWVALVTILVIAGSYVLGILVDRLADSVHARLDRVWPTRPVDKPAGIAKMRFTVLRDGGALATFIEYQRSRLRIARSTAVNGVLGAPAVVSFSLSGPTQTLQQLSGSGQPFLSPPWRANLLFAESNSPTSLG
jgi:hypothetical protein